MSIEVSSRLLVCSTGDKWYDKMLSVIPGQKYLRAIISAVHNYGLYSTTSFHDWIGYEFTKQVQEKENSEKESNSDKKTIKDKPNITFKEVMENIVLNIKSMKKMFY